MSASSGSYVAGADIIDLDRYMRASVRPSRHGRTYTRERFVVDAGEADRVPVEALSSSNSDAPSLPRTQYCKRYSHDSGLSEDTYVKRRHKPPRRTNENKYREPDHTVASNSSVREFRAACEKALREQQEQIARVAAICEKLVQPQVAQTFPQNVTNLGHGVSDVPQLVQTFDQNSNIGGGPNVNKVNLGYNEKQNTADKRNFSQNVTPKIKRPPLSTDSSDVTSTTCSSRNIRMKNKHRTESCKTYNLIMGKLDELNYLFSTRRAAPVGGARARSRISSYSVSMSDKVVATEGKNFANTPIIQVMHSSRMSDRPTSEGRRSNPKQFAIKHAPAVDIAPSAALEDLPVHRWLASAGGAGVEAFDLDDPLHLYAQAKHLQALHTSPRYTSSNRGAKLGDQLDGKMDEKLDGSLCALCRGYWRVVRRFVKQQLFGTCS